MLINNVFGTVKYKDLLLRMIAALIGAHVIVANGAKYSFFQLLSLPYYYLSLFGSFIIAFVLIAFIYWTTCRLDLRYNWQQSFFRRSVLQVCFGIVVTSILAALLATIYFLLFKISINQTTYFKYNFKLIIALIVIVNAYYVFQYVFKVYVFPGIIENTEIEASPIYPVGWPDYQPLLLYYMNGNRLAIHHDGTHRPWHFNLRDSMKYLPANKYFFINNWCIVSLDIIESQEKINEIDGKLVKATYYKVNLKVKFGKEIISSGRKSASFRHWWKKYAMSGKKV